MNGKTQMNKQIIKWAHKWTEANEGISKQSHEQMIEWMSEWNKKVKNTQMIKWMDKWTNDPINQ